MLVPEKVLDEVSRLGSRRAMPSLGVKYTCISPVLRAYVTRAKGQETSTEVPQEQNAQGQLERTMGRALQSSKQTVKHKSDKTSGSCFK